MRTLRITSREGAVVLVHCARGISRSPAVAYGLLLPILGQNAMREVQALRPQARPNRRLVKYLDQLHGR